MAGDRTLPSETITRKPDDDVGSRGTPAAAGGGHTPEQAAITDLGAGGRSDAERNHGWGEADGRPGRNPAPIGGSSGGHSDQKAGESDRMQARGHYKVEKDAP